MLQAVTNIGLGGALWERFPLELATPDGASFVYSTLGGDLSTPDGGSGAFDVYNAQRSSTGWSTTDRISRSSKSVAWTTPGGISDDHSYAFTNEDREDYLRKADGTFELTGKGSLAEEPYAQGRYISEGGSHVVFTTGNQTGNLQSVWCFANSKCKVRRLEPNSPPEGTGAIYDRTPDGPTHVISLLPGDLPPAAGQQAFYQGVSRDASSVAFTIEGSLFVRADNGLETERTEEVAPADPAFAGLSREGRYLFYVEGGEKGTIHRFDTTNEVDVEVNPVGEGEIVNISTDGSHVYFISEQQLDGAKGVAGQPNMYVWSGGTRHYVTTVLPSDLSSTSGEGFGAAGLTAWTEVASPNENFARGPGAESSRSTPDGTALVFESRGQLTSYVNAAHTEIYRWDDSDQSLLCVSCSTLSEPAGADARLQELEFVDPAIVVHNLSADGSRVFFETEEALRENDSNGANDIYEWQEGQAGEPQALISSGRSPAYPLAEEAVGAKPFIPAPNVLVAITPEGSDVFFSGREALVPGAGENGTQAIYDARVDGGFPVSVSPPVCAEEGCRPLGSSERLAPLTAKSEENGSGGNVKPRKRHCKSNPNAKAGKRRHCQKKHGQRKRNRSAGEAKSSLASAGSSPSEDSRSSEEGEASGLTTSSINLVNPSPPVTPASSTSAPVASAGLLAESFGIERFAGSVCEWTPTKCEPSSPITGAHPDFTTILEFNHTQNGKVEDATAAIEELQVHLPPGLLGNPRATPTCSMGAFLSYANCSPDSQVGVTFVTVGNPAFVNQEVPIYNITPPHPEEEVIRLGFIAFLPIFIDAKVRTAGDYGATAVVHSPPGLGVVIRAKTTLWGNPSGTEHDKKRFTMYEVGNCPLGIACLAPEGKRASTIAPAERKAFMTDPSACQPMTLSTEVKSYQLPGQLFTASAPLDPITDCSGLPFAPTFEADPTSHEAGAPTGLKTKLVLPQHLGPDERATSTMREARVTLPEGMQVAAGAANWIGTCSEAQVGFHEEVDTACPDNAKLGTATITSPALSAPIEGTIYQRDPRPGNQLGLWLTADALGMHIKLPGSLEPDKTTGRLTAVFTDLPQVPVEEIDLNVWGGPRAPLQNPDHCGTFTTNFSFSPHSNDPAATGQSTMQITEGCNQPFDPSLHAGVTDPVAAKYSPFVFDLTRPDGNQALRGFNLKLPDGELAKVKGVPLCSDADAAAARCPQGSRVGHLQATTGPGPEPFTLPEPGKPQPQIYLAGPYKGAPFSIVSEVPAQAGPFDLGTLAVRSGLEVEPETGQAVVKADPLPQFFEGVGIAYRNLHAVVDRPEFSLNPTDCREMAVNSDVTSTQGTVAHPQARFQVDGCKALKFKPRLSLQLKGGTKRADYPALTAVLKARKGDANIAFTSVALPHSEFLAQEHIGTICTRKQFAADTCPKKSVYGKAKAITPLLAKPLSGPVYLRSSDHPLPDLVAKLGGELEIDLVGRIDSKHGGIRTTFESVPDAPVTKFVLQMRGGKKGLLTNSTDICRGSHRATVQMKAQNGRAVDLRPKLQSQGCGKKKLDKSKHHR